MIVAQPNVNVKKDNVCGTTSSIGEMCTDCTVCGKICVDGMKCTNCTEGEAIECVGSTNPKARTTRSRTMFKIKHLGRGKIQVGKGEGVLAI